MNEERVSYNDIKDSFLRCYYTLCKSKIDDMNRGRDGWDNDESERGYAYYQYENAYDLPIENLMLEVFTLIMMAGRGPAHVEKNFRRSIKEILSKNSLDELLNDIDEEEKADLLYDMSLLGLIDKKESFQ